MLIRADCTQNNCLISRNSWNEGDFDLLFSIYDPLIIDHYRRFDRIAFHHVRFIKNKWKYEEKNFEKYFIDHRWSSQLGRKIIIAEKNWRKNVFLKDKQWVIALNIRNCEEEFLTKRDYWVFEDFLCLQYRILIEYDLILKTVSKLSFERMKIIKLSIVLRKTSLSSDHSLNFVKSIKLVLVDEAVFILVSLFQKV